MLHKKKNPAEAGFLNFSDDYIFYFMRAILRVCVKVPDVSLKKHTPLGMFDAFHATVYVPGGFSSSTSTATSRPRRSNTDIRTRLSTDCPSTPATPPAGRLLGAATGYCITVAGLNGLG